MPHLVRSAERSDLDAILDIEKSVNGGKDRDYFLMEMDNSLCSIWLAVEILSKQVDAFLLGWQLDEADFEIHHLATHAKFQRQGLARLLLDHLRQFATRRQLKRLLLEVRESNQPAIRLYEGFGFMPIGLRKEYYRHPDENARVYQYGIFVDK